MIITGEAVFFFGIAVGCILSITIYTVMSAYGYDYKLHLTR